MREDDCPCHDMCGLILTRELVHGRCLAMHAPDASVPGLFLGFEPFGAFGERGGAGGEPLRFAD